MNKGTVSVVIPIYNVEKYLDRCIESVVEQTYKTLEILLIDDGSPDNCPEICDGWAQRDSRIRVIHKENAGLGMARNTGIENATGEYICFFDSDDFIAPDTIEKAYLSAVKNGSDAVVFGLHTVDSNENIVKSFIPYSEHEVYCGEEVLSDFLPEYIAPDPKGDGTRKFYMSACLLMYSIECIKRNGWRFVSERDIISEDIYSLMDFFANVKCVSVIREAFYYYRANPTSLSHSYKPDRYNKIKDFYLNCIELCKRHKYSEDIIHRASKPYLAYTISALKQECTVPRPSSEVLYAIKAIIDDKTLQTVLNNNKKDKVSLTRKILFFTIRHRLYRFAYLLLKSRV